MTATLSPDLLEVRCYTVREVAEHLGTSPGLFIRRSTLDVSPP